MKLPEKLEQATETSSGSSVFQIRDTVNQLIDYLAEREKSWTCSCCGNRVEEGEAHDCPTFKKPTPLFKASDIINLGYNLNFRSEEAAEQAREALLKISK